MKKIFSKVLKYTKIGILSILAVFIVFLSVCYINNQIQLKKEAKLLVPPGKIVEVKGKKFHVYAEGKGDLTCVFMAGSGNVAPEVDFKPLYKNMSSEYRIAVVDRAGYGFSENSNDSRDIDTILEETRKTLALAGEKPPYVLFPHSISGIEAIYWAQKYPEEVKAIIGLDIGYPEVYLEHNLSKSTLFVLNAQSFLTKFGVHRLFPSMALQEVVLDSNLLSKDDKELYKALTYKKLQSSDTVNELNAIEKNSKKSLALKLPTKIPICIFLPVPLTEEERNQKSTFLKERYNYYNNYVSKFEKGKVITLPGRHSIYLYSPDDIAKESKAFLRSISNP